MYELYVLSCSFNNFLDISSDHYVRQYQIAAPSIRTIPTSVEYLAAAAEHAEGAFSANQGGNNPWPSTTGREVPEVQAAFGRLLAESLPRMVVEARMNGNYASRPNLMGYKEPDLYIYSNTGDVSDIATREVLVIGQIKTKDYLTDGDRGQLLECLNSAFFKSGRKQLMGVLICPGCAEVYEMVRRDDGFWHILLRVEICFIKEHSRPFNWDILISLVACGTLLPTRGVDRPSYISMGTSSIVMRYGDMARKYFLHPYVGLKQFANEVRILTELNSKLPFHRMIPLLHQATDKERLLPLVHIDTTLYGRAPRPDKITPDLFCELIMLLQQVHETGIVHCDVRLANLVNAGSDQDERIVLVDWAAAGKVNDVVRWSGTLATLDNDTLLCLDYHAPVTLRPAHDLHAVWRTAFLARNEITVKDVNDLVQAGDYIGIRLFWKVQVQLYPEWKSAENAAEAEDYEGLKIALPRALAGPNWMSD